MKYSSGTNQLWWVILLLASAVILPTVCLLWFMNQAVKNERLAMQQKLVDIYTKRAMNFFIEFPNNYFDSLIKHLDSYPVNNTQGFFETFAVGPQGIFNGMLIYDPNGNILYPGVSFEEPSEQEVQPIAVKSKENIELVHELSYPENPQDLQREAVAAVMRNRVFLAELYLQAQDGNLFYHLRRVLSNSHYNNEKESGSIDGPLETTIWQLERMIDIAIKAGLAEELANEIKIADNRIAAYENALEIAYLYPKAENLNDWPNQTIRKISGQSQLYGFKFKAGDKTVLGISSINKLLKVILSAVEDMQDDTISIQVLDNSGKVIAGNSDKAEKPFLTLTAGSFLPDFTVSLFFKDSSVFEKAARRQTSIYTWTGILVIAMVSLSGFAAIRAVGNQIKMNRLKNDFIATVTHELKTPLASMRLLVDTLLEKRYEDEKTATEYLQMVSCENKRLTHLIDSFLTFSRMERNKQVFDFVPVAPTEIASVAIEAIKTKFSNGNCCFKTKIDESLPAICADKDAIVMVLVNLLDNAYKYTTDDKQIELSVYRQNGFTCFAVADNGIGISRRQQKKIFNRFYQVDSRLSRSVEGCGLGLSIVKFIVDAHKGKIEVQSSPCKGSVFTVKLPDTSQS